MTWLDLTVNVQENLHRPLLVVWCRTLGQGCHVQRSVLKWEVEGEHSKKNCILKKWVGFRMNIYFSCVRLVDRVTVWSDSRG